MEGKAIYVSEYHNGVKPGDAIEEKGEIGWDSSPIFTSKSI